MSRRGAQDGAAATAPPEEAVDALLEIVAEHGIPSKDFAAAYKELRQATPAAGLTSYAALKTQYQDRPGRDIEAATEEVRRAGLLDRFALLLAAKAPQPDAALAAVNQRLAVLVPLGTPGGAAAAAPAPGPAGGAVGTHQAIFHDEGLRDTRWAEAVATVTPRIALLHDRRASPTARGTGFLVGPDLLLTAAHVVGGLVDHTKTPAEIRAELARNLVAEFHHHSLAGPRGKRDVTPADGWLVHASAPCGDWPDIDLGDEAAQSKLDFALIRLAEPVGDEIGFLDIDDPPVPQPRTSGLALIGHPGGSALAYHVHYLDAFERPIGRLQHKVNAAEGMSGSPCLTMDGQVIGLHEGKVEQPKGTPRYNRSIYIRPVRDSIHARLVELGEPGLPRPGADLSWLPDTAEARKLLEQVFSGRAPPARPRHPVFGRRAFLEWVAETARPSPAVHRAAFVSSESRAGVSFTGALLRARLNRASDVLCEIRPEAARAASLASIHASLMAALGARAEAGPATTGARPEAGVLTHDTVPNMLDLAEQLLTRGAAGASAVRRLWLFVDFGADAAWSAGASRVWKEVLAQASRRAWLRLVVAGLNRNRQWDVLTVVSNMFTEEVQPPDAAGLADFVERHVFAALDPAARQARRREFIERWGQMAEAPATGRTDTLATRAVRAVVTLRDAVA